MTNFRYLIFLLVLPLLCGADMPRERPGEWAQPFINTTIGNLYKVSNDVFRAEQPEKKDIPDLQTLKIKTLLNLREYHEDDILFKQNGFGLVHHKVDTGSVSTKDLIAVLKLLSKAEKPVLVHCWHGSDRTGFMVAGYRIVFQNWTREAAIEELRLGGYGYHSKAYPNVIKLLQEMDVDAVEKSSIAVTKIAEADMEIRVVNLEEKAGLIQELHKYKLVAELNDYQFKLVKARREFVWHSHEETDEMFFVVEGQMQLAFRDKIFNLKKGELIVVPKGVEHKPICDTLCTVMLVEPKGTLNTGSAGGALTDTNLEWI